MNFNWNLSELFDSNESFYMEIEKINLLISNIKKYQNQELNGNILLKMLNDKWKIKELSNNILIYGSLMYYKNIESEECIKLKRDAEDFVNKVDLELLFIDRKILELGEKKVDEYLRENHELSIYQQFFDNLFRTQTHVQDDETNQEIKNYVQIINKLLNQYNMELKDLKYGEIEIDGEKVEIDSSNFVKYLASNDRNIRREAYLTVYKAFKNKGEVFANILNKLLDCRIKIATLEKYYSVLDKVLFEENINPETINSLIKAVNNNLELIQEYFTIKSNVLKIEDPHLYDFNVPLNNDLKIEYSLDEAIEIIKNALKPLGEDYLKIVECLLDGHIDAMPDDNKHQSIIFSWNTFSFMNYRGNYIDLKNLIHELGHIVNYYLSKKNLPFIYEDSTIFVGETASLVNEILLNKYLYENAKTDEEKIFYLSKEIENYFTTVFKQTLYTEYENDIYKLRASQELTLDILSAEYMSLIKKYYGENIIYDKETETEWIRLGHLYRWSYYPYKYATGLLIASTVINLLINEKTLSKEQYLNFLSLGSSKYSLDLLKTINIDFTNEKIIEDGFEVLKNDIANFKKYYK